MCTHAIVHINENKLWTTLNDPLENHDQILEKCEYHLVFLGTGKFIELVERQHPLITVYSDEDVKTIEIGQLTFDEDDTLNSVISRGLGKSLDSQPSMKSTSIPLSQVSIKEEPLDNLEAESRTEQSSTLDDVGTSTKTQAHTFQPKESDIQTRLAKRELVVKSEMLAIDGRGIVIMTDELKQKMLSSRSGYDSDETIIYNLDGINIPELPKSSKQDTKPRNVQTPKLEDVHPNLVFGSLCTELEGNEKRHIWDAK